MQVARGAQTCKVVLMQNLSLSTSTYKCSLNGSGRLKSWLMSLEGPSFWKPPTWLPTYFVRKHRTFYLHLPCSFACSTRTVFSSYENRIRIDQTSNKLCTNPNKTLISTSCYKGELLSALFQEEKNNEKTNPQIIFYCIWKLIQ